MVCSSSSSWLSSLEALESSSSYRSSRICCSSAISWCNRSISFRSVSHFCRSSSPVSKAYSLFILHGSMTGSATNKAYSFTLLGNRTGPGTRNGTSTIGNNGSWFLFLSRTSVNTSVQHISTHCSLSRSLYLSRSRAV